MAKLTKWSARVSRRAGRAVATATFLAAALPAGSVTRPTARLVEVEAGSVMRFPAGTDSNSPAFWSYERGSPELVIFNSAAGRSLRSSGPELSLLGDSETVSYLTPGGGGRWIEAVVEDEAGVLYGYYHQEPIGLCASSGKTAPRIGAVRSRDAGRSWEDLGIVLESPSRSFDCESPNEFFAGGVGDFSVVLNADRTELYLFFSHYSGEASEQGVAVARMLWADRDAPVGKLSPWRLGLWEAPSGTSSIDASGARVSPIFKNQASWHEDGKLGIFWGPSVHWNTYLKEYVMLLNRSEDARFDQEGIYVSFSPTLDDPIQWSSPEKILDEGEWYPQVIGLDPGEGTDKSASQTARFFLGGRSNYLIKFSRP